MGKYTVYNQPWIDEQIQEHLDIAARIIKQRIRGVVSIILTGGFGRGEGSVKLENNKMIPLNDYDIYAILDKGFKAGELESQKLAKEIEKQIGTPGFSLYRKSEKSFYFDIRFLDVGELANLPPFIKYYEMKNASLVLFGRDARNLMPDYQPNNLPISEGLRFMLNRLSSIFLWGPADLIRKKELPQWHKDTLLYDISKSYIEIGTYLCQLADVYKPTYQERLIGLKRVFSGRFPELKKENPDLPDKIAYYTELKLRPEYGAISDYSDRWFAARDDLLAAVKFALRESFSVNGFDEFFSRLAKSYFRPYLRIILERKFHLKKSGFVLPLVNFLAQFYLSAVWFFRICRFEKKIYLPILFDWRDPGLRIYNSLLFIVSSVRQNGEIDAETLSKGIKTLKKAYPVKSVAAAGLDDFQAIADSYVNAWKLYFFQSI